MNYLSDAFRYVAGADDDKQGEVYRLVERIRSSSLAQDRRGAVVRLTRIAHDDPLRKAEIGETGLKVFFTVLDQDGGYEDSVSAVIDLLIAVCSSTDVHADGGDQRDSPRSLVARQVAATNVDMFLGLPGAMSLILGLLQHDDFHVRCAALELLTAMAGNAQTTVQAAILDTVQGVNIVCDLLDDGSHVVRSNSILLLSVLCAGSPAVSNIVAFSGVPDKLINVVIVVEANASGLTASERDDFVDGGLEAAIVVHDVLQLLGSIINCSGTTRAALREMSTVRGIVAVLAQVSRDLRPSVEKTSLPSPSEAFQSPLRKQCTQNVLLCVSNVADLLKGDAGDVEHMTSLMAATDIFSQLHNLVFLQLADREGSDPTDYRDLTRIRLASLHAITTLVQANTNMRRLYYSSLYPSGVLETATPMMCTLHTMMLDRSLALRMASYTSLRESFVLDLAAGVQSLSWSSSGIHFVKMRQADAESDSDDDGDDEVSIPATYLGILAEYLKNALSGYASAADGTAVYYSSALLSWTILRVAGARERLFASYAHSSESSLLALVLRVLADAEQQKAAVSVRVGLLTLVCSWLLDSASTVTAFLSSRMPLSVLVDILRSGTDADDVGSVQIKGLAATVLCILLSTDSDCDTDGEDGFISGGRGPSMVVPKGSIPGVIRDHVGIASFMEYIAIFKGTRQSPSVTGSDDLWNLASEVAATESQGKFPVSGDSWYDAKLVAFLGDACGQVTSNGLELLSNAPPAVKQGEQMLSQSSEFAVTQSNQDMHTTSFACMEMRTNESADNEAPAVVLNNGDGAPFQPRPGNPNGHKSDRVGEAHHEDPRVPDPNITVSRQNAALLSEGYHCVSDLQETVQVLERNLASQNEERQALLDELEICRRHQTDWRRQAEEGRSLLEQERNQRHELSLTVERMKSSAVSQAEEIVLSNHRLSELEERCADLSEMRKRTEEEVVGLRGEVTSRAEQSVEVSSKLFEAEERNERLEDETKKLSSQLAVAVASGQNGASSRELETLRADLAASQEMNNHLRSNVSRLEAEQRKGVAERQNVAALNGELAKLSNILGDTVEKSSILAKQLQSEKSAALELKEKCAHAESDRAKAAERYASAESDRARAAAELVSVSRALAEREVESEKQMLKICTEKESVEAAKVELEKSLNRVQEELSCSSQSLAEKEEECKTLTGAFGTQNAELKKENEALRRRVDVAEAQLVQQPSESFVSALNDELAELSNALGDTVEKSSILAQQLQSEKSAALELKEKCAHAESDRAKAAADLSSASRALAEKQLECKKLVSDAAESKSAADSVEARLLQIRAERDALLVEKKKLGEEVSYASRAVAAKEEDCKSLDSAKAELSDIVSKRDALLAEKDGELRMIRGELSSTSRALANKEVECKKLVDEVAANKSTLEVFQARSAELIAERDALSTEKAKLASSLKKLGDEASSASKKLAEREAVFKKSANASERENERLKASNEELQKRIDDVEKTLEEMRMASEEFDKTIAKARASSEAHGELRREHDELLVCLAELDAECNQLKEEAGRA